MIHVIMLHLQQNEAIRIAKKTPEFRNTESLVSKIQDFQNLTNKDGLSLKSIQCCHGKNVFTSLAHLKICDK